MKKTLLYQQQCNVCPCNDQTNALNCKSLLIFNIDLKSRLVLLAFMQFTDENALQRMKKQLIEITNCWCTVVWSLQFIVYI